MNDPKRSQKTVKIIIIVGIILVALLIFQAGTYVGFRRGVFASNWGSAYQHRFDDPHSIFAPFMSDPDDMNPHGVVGKIISVHLPTMMIKGKASTERIVILSTTTTIRLMHGQASTSDLVAGSQVIVTGNPGSQGQIDADFIRILSQPSTSSRQNISRVVNGSE